MSSSTYCNTAVDQVYMDLPETIQNIQKQLLTETYIFRKSCSDIVLLNHLIESSRVERRVSKMPQQIKKNSRELGELHVARQSIYKFAITTSVQIKFLREQLARLTVHGASFEERYEESMTSFEDSINRLKRIEMDSSLGSDGETSLFTRSEMSDTDSSFMSVMSELSLEGDLFLVTTL